MLDDTGYSVWSGADELHIGDSLAERIKEALAASRYVIALAPGPALASQAVRHELATALDLGKDVVWARVEPAAKITTTDLDIHLTDKSLPNAAKAVLSFLRGDRGPESRQAIRR